MGVVVDRCHFGGNTVLIATEIDYSVEALVATTAMAAGDYTSVVATLAAMFGHHKRTFGFSAGDFTEVCDHPGAGSWGVRAEGTDCHDVSDPSGLREELDRVALGKPHHGFLYLGSFAGKATHPTATPRWIHGADADYTDVEELFYGRFDIGLGSAMVNLKGVLVLFKGASRLFGN
jgi:hypothetical protein